jgi:hypothetical protein
MLKFFCAVTFSVVLVTLGLFGVVKQLRPQPVQAQTTCPGSAAFGKVASSEFTLIDRVGPVIFVAQDGTVYTAPVDRGGYDVALPGCTRFRAGVLTTRGYYFETQNVMTDDTQNSVNVDFIGIAR